MRWTLPLLLAALSTWIVPAPARACGPFFQEAYFAFSTHPDPPFAPYAAGRLGVLRPGYARSYLVVAYRQLEGIPTTAEDQATAVALWERRLKMPSSVAGGDAPDPEQAWLTARNAVADKVRDLEPQDSLNPYHPLENSYYYHYLNCTPDALRTAAATLDGLVADHGARNQHVAEWVRGQDEVFANCDGGRRAIPVVEAADAGRWSRAPAVFRQHRAYQIAAAHFYAGEYDEAHRRFLAIAEDPSSPWAELAPYLAARALVREGMLAGDQPFDIATLQQAQQQIAAVLADEQRAAVHGPARALQDYVAIHLEPEPQVHVLAGRLTAPSDGVPLGTSLDDYTRLLDRFVEWNRLEGLHPQDDPLTDWVLTYQATGDEVTAYAVQRWQQTRSTAWLIAALSKVGPDHPELAPLLEHAAAIPPEDPGYVTVCHARVALLLALDRRDEARTLLDEALARDDLPRSARNQLLAQRLQVARVLDEVLRYLPRTPVCVGEDEYWAVQECGAEPLPVLVDRDGALVIQELPLSLVAQVAADESLPAGVRRNVARAGFTRAVLAGDHEHGVVLGRTLLALEPTLAEWFDPYLAATEPAEREQAALYALVWLPGLRPQVEGGLTRDLAWSAVDSYRDNWWCAPVVDPRDVPTLAFLDGDQRAERERERTALADLPTAPDLLCQLAVAWAEADPDDARVPAALHRAVRASRHGCTSAETGTWSRQAFQTLHRQYPDSPWTAETPYWYK